MALKVEHVIGKMVGSSVEPVMEGRHHNIDSSQIVFDYILNEDSACISHSETEAYGDRAVELLSFRRLFRNLYIFESVFRQERCRIVHSKISMSLTGPRSGPPRKVALYGGRAVRRLSVKPRCGEAWQTSGCSDVGFERMVELDLQRIENQSTDQDLKLILDILCTMLSGKRTA